MPNETLQESGSQPIPFCRKTNLPESLTQIASALDDSLASSRQNKTYVELGEQWLRETLAAETAFLVPSGSAALDLSAVLSQIGAGEKFLVSSFTFPSTANAFMLRGAEPVFVDIRPDTLCMDEALIEQAIDSQVHAIVVTHYAGVGAEMDQLVRIAEKHGLLVIEDAAHCILAKYRGKHLGSIGDLGVLSFHHTKNIHCGEGGALLVNNALLRENAEVVHDKGTNRCRFLRGEIAEYSWVEVGGNFRLAEILAAYLLPQFLSAAEITGERLGAWQYYQNGLSPLEERGDLRLPSPPEGCEHNAHIFHLRTENRKVRTELIEFLSERGIQAVTHYSPLHSSPLGRRLGFSAEDLPVTQHAADTLLRLPLYYGLTDADCGRIVSAVNEFFYGK